MRISTNTFFESTSSKLSDLQSSLAKTQEQISTGRRIQTSADDPVAAARALTVSQSKNINLQYGANRRSASDSLNSVEGSLSSVTSTLQDARVLIVNAGSPALSSTERGFLATQLSTMLADLTNSANTTDGNGNYLFSGFQSTTAAFSPTAAGATYNGDQGQRQLEVSAGNFVSISETGDSIFNKIKTGNGTFAVSSAVTNTGTATFNPGDVVNAAAVTGESYKIAFKVVGGATSYDLTNTSTGAVISTNNAYVSGQSITVGGLSVNIQGSPANTDTFSLTPSLNESIFTTIQSAIAALKQPDNTPGALAKLGNALTIANKQISNGLDNVLTVRAFVGSRLNELSSIDNSGSATDLQYAQTLSDLQNVDYVKAISDLTQQRTILEASQSSFVKISNLSLFDYIK